jgi:hypothetical protein
MSGVAEVGVVTEADGEARETDRLPVEAAEAEAEAEAEADMAVSTVLLDVAGRRLVAVPMAAEANSSVLMVTGMIGRGWEGTPSCRVGPDVG